MTARPCLPRHRRPLRRGSGAVQFGVGPGGLVLGGLSDAELGFLEGLDGSRDFTALLLAAAERHIPTDRARTLLGVLRDLGIVLDTPTSRADLAVLPEGLRHLLRPDAEALAAAYGRGDGYAVLAARRARAVLVDGHGALVDAVTDLLRRAGVGRVWSGRYAGAEPPGGRPPSAAEAPDLVVLAAAGAVDATRGDPWRARGVPHLPLVSLGSAALVGPLVLPGRTACLVCMDLARAQRDPAWPSVLAQLVPAGVATPEEVAGETSVVSVAAGAAAMMVLGHLDGQHQPPGVSVEVTLPWPGTVARRWSPHPACTCLSRTTRREAAGGMPRPRVTMAP